MKKDFCYFCFQSLSPKDGKIVQCTTCHKIYHERHWEGECLHCTNKLNKAYRPVSLSQSRSVIRNPIKLKRRSIQENENNGLVTRTIIEIFTQAKIAFRLFVSVLIATSLATLIGAYTSRLLKYSEFDKVIPFINSIIRNETPPVDVFYAAFIAALFGAYVFYPVQLLNSSGKKSFVRRLVRLFAVIILLIYFNLLMAEINLQIIEDFLTSDRSQIVDTFASTAWIAQIGALSISLMFGFVVRGINSPLSTSKFPRWIQYFIGAIKVIWHFTAAIVVLWSAFFITINFLQPYSQSPILFEIGQRSINTDAIQLITIAIISFVAVLIYYPPKHSVIKKSWWLVRGIGCVVCFAVFIIIFRATPVESTEFIIRTVLLSTCVSVSFLPVYKAIG